MNRKDSHQQHSSHRRQNRKRRPVVQFPPVEYALVGFDRCYKALKSSIGERLQQYTSAHSALIEVATALLDAARTPRSMKCVVSSTSTACALGAGEAGGAQRRLAEVARCEVQPRLD